MVPWGWVRMRRAQKKERVQEVMCKGCIQEENKP